MKGGCMRTGKFRFKVFLLCIPGFSGFLLFYLLPFCKSLFYAFMKDSFQKEFVWFDNFKTVLENEFFRLALKNTVIFSLLGVALLLLLSFFLAYGLSALVKRTSFIKNSFLLPMFLPTISTIFAWRLIFESDLYFGWMKSGVGFVEALPIYVLYLWKNTGMNVILLTAAFANLPAPVLEAAEMDGARGWRRLRHIILPLTVPTLFFVGILSFVSSMKIFKESFLFFKTGYPPYAVYTVQYYMNNHFQKLNYQNLSCASVIVAVLIGILIFAVYRIQNKMWKDVELE